MMGKPNHLEPKLFYHGFSLEQRIPDDHPLRRVEQLVDFQFIRSQVAHLYGDRGNESIDPAVILKFMFLLFYENIKSERALIDQLPLRLDWLWFCGYDLDDDIPHHSVISKARRRWGVEVFIRFFENILAQCVAAGLVDGHTLHVDSSMIDGNASKDSLHCGLRMLSRDFYERLEDQADPAPLPQRVSSTDPDARLGKKYGKTTLGYKDHRAVDDQQGIITATITTPANVNDDQVLADLLDAHQNHTQTKTDAVAADKAYGTGENYKHLYHQGITPCISHKRKNCNRQPGFNNDQFVYDPDGDLYLCPAGQTLTFRQFSREKNAAIYRANRQTCQGCRYFEKCVTGQQTGRQIQRNANEDYIAWADHCLPLSTRKRLMARRKYKAEGSFADATNNHGLKRARFRGLEKVQMQNLMIAAIQNLRKLLRHVRRQSAVQAVKRALILHRFADFLAIRQSRLLQTVFQLSWKRI